MALPKLDVFGDDSATIARGLLRLHRHGEPGKPYWLGDYVCPLGIVTVYRQINLTRLDAVIGGRLHMRTWPRFVADTTIPRLARDVLAGARP